MALPTSPSLRGRSRSAFTLIEIMLAVMITLFLVLTLNRFLVANLTALRLSNDASAERQSMLGLVSMLQTQLTDLPPSGQNLLLGQPHKFNDRSADTLEWTTRGGIGLMTTAAQGEYHVSLEIIPNKQNPRILDLVLRRRLVDEKRKDADNLWTLMSPISALEIRYFHPQLNAKVDRWADGNTLPSLVYLSIQRNPDVPPYEAVLTVPAANLQK